MIVRCEHVRHDFTDILDDDMLINAVENYVWADETRDAVIDNGYINLFINSPVFTPEYEITAFLREYNKLVNFR